MFKEKNVFKLNYGQFLKCFLANHVLNDLIVKEGGSKTRLPLTRLCQGILS